MLLQRRRVPTPRSNPARETRPPDEPRQRIATALPPAALLRARSIEDRIQLLARTAERGCRHPRVVRTCCPMPRWQSPPGRRQARNAHGPASSAGRLLEMRVADSRRNAVSVGNPRRVVDNSWALRRKWRVVRATDTPAQKTWLAWFTTMHGVVVAASARAGWMSSGERVRPRRPLRDTGDAGPPRVVNGSDGGHRGVPGGRRIVRPPCLESGANLGESQQRGVAIDVVCDPSGEHLGMPSGGIQLGGDVEHHPLAGGG